MSNPYHVDAETAVKIIEELQQRIIALEAELAKDHTLKWQCGGCENRDGQIRTLEAELAKWKSIATDWSDAADRAQQPEVFYAEYSEKTMRAMQALMTKAKAQLASKNAVMEDLSEQVDTWIDKAHELEAELAGANKFIAFLRESTKQKRLEELESALKAIAEHPHCRWYGPEPYDPSHADGHRCAAKIAQEALDGEALEEK